MKVQGISREIYEEIFPQIQTYLESAAHYTFNRFTAEDIKQGLRDKNQQLWIAHIESDIYGFVVTEIVTYPQMTALVMHFTAGKQLPKWKDEMLREIKAFAKLHNCNTIESYGRPGWAKVFKNDGYKQQFIYYELPVENTL